MLLFVGMNVMNLFGDILNRAPGLVLSNVNYVKKAVFPLAVLPAIAVSASGFSAVHHGQPPDLHH